MRLRGDTRMDDTPRHERARSGWASAAGLAVLAAIITTLLLSGPAQAGKASAAEVPTATTPRQVLTTSTATANAATNTITTWAISSAGCGKAPPVAAGTSGMRTLVSGGHVRQYLLHIPHGYLATHEYPLVLNFHGHSGTAVQQERATGFSQLADTANFVVAYPQGLAGPGGQTGWASGGPNKPETDDVLFVANLLTRIQSEVCINPRRIYATGFSNGGGMTSLLACKLAGRIAAFASVSGSYFAPAGGCHPGRAVSILEMHGTADAVVPYSGRPAQAEQGAMSWLTAWAGRDGCAAMPASTDVASGVTQLTWSACAEGVSVVHFRLTGGVHTWPTEMTYATDTGRHAVPPVDRVIDATAIIWRFFARYELPVAPVRAARA